ncbi:MAG: peptide/nickel transport system substrate-binding protein [Streptomyces sp.]|nr:peptide/nickel transport system substrate-binding protein [Streptomyces sp.]
MNYLALSNDSIARSDDSRSGGPEIQGLTKDGAVMASSRSADFSERSEGAGRPVSRRRLLVAGAGAAAGSWLLTACGSGASGTAAATSAASGTAKAGGVLRIARPPASSAETLDPASSLSAYEYLGALYSRLVRRGTDGNPAADLATSWEMSDNASTWTFHLRKGVTFHNGKSFTAADAAYTIGHILDPATKSPQAGVLSSFVDTSGITAADDTTLVVRLKTPHAEFPTLLMHYNCYVIPDGSGATIGKQGIGTGPFKLTSFTAAGKGAVAANLDYYGGRPTLDSIDFSSIADVQSRVNALLAQQVDLIAQTNLDAASVTTVMASSSATVVEVKNAEWYTLPMLCTAAPFTDTTVRQAFKLAYDPQQVMQLAIQNHGIIGHDNPVPTDDPYHVDYSVAPDPDKAKSLLKQAGHDGLKISLYTSDYDSVLTPLALAMKDSLAQAGITVAIQNAPSDSYYTNVWMQKPFCTSYWYTGRPISQLLSEIFQTGSGYNESKWSNPTLDGLITSARKETDAAKRKTLYADAQKLIVDQSGTIMPFFASRMTGIGKNVVNYHESGFEFNYLTLGLKA